MPYTGCTAALGVIEAVGVDPAYSEDDQRCGGVVVRVQAEVSELFRCSTPRSSSSVRRRLPSPCCLPTTTTSTPCRTASRVRPSCRARRENLQAMRHSLRTHDAGPQLTLEDGNFWELDLTAHNNRRRQHAHTFAKAL